MQHCNCTKEDSIFLLDEKRSMKMDAVCIRCGKRFVFYPEDKRVTKNLTTQKRFFELLRWEFKNLQEENLNDTKASLFMLTRIAEIYPIYVDKFSIYKFADVREAVQRIIGSDYHLAYEMNIVFYNRLREILCESTKTSLQTLSAIAKYLVTTKYSNDSLIQMFGPLAITKVHEKYISEEYEKVVRNYVFDFIVSEFVKSKKIENFAGYVTTFYALDQRDPMKSTFAKKTILDEYAKISSRILSFDAAVSFAVEHR